MKIYHYDKNTYEFLCETTAKLSPLDNNFILVPAYATTIKPELIATRNKAIVFDFKNKLWILVDDYRQTVYFQKNGEKHIITTLGETIPSTGTIIPPDPKFIKPNWDGKSWKESALIYKNLEVSSKSDVDKITKFLIAELGEEKEKTLKMLNPNSPGWDNFVKSRNKLIAEGNLFVTANKLS